MADVFDAEKRSDIMRRVKSKKNKSTELRLIEIFKDHGITGWRRNYPVKGHPDFVFPRPCLKNKSCTTSRCAIL